MIYQLLALLITTASLTASESTNEHTNLCKQLICDITNYDKDFSDKDLERYIEQGVDITSNDFCKKPLLTYYLSHRSVRSKSARDIDRRNHILKRTTILLEHGANPNHVLSITHFYPKETNLKPYTETTTPLIDASISKISDSSLISLLIKYGANTNICTTDGYSPLFAACCEDKPNISHIATLINNNANVSIVVENRLNHYHCLNMLLVAIINRQEKHKRYDAVKKSMRYLLKNEYPLINLQDNDGNTVLHFASIHVERSFPVIRLLLKYGADPYIKNKNNESFAYKIIIPYRPASFNEDLNSTRNHLMNQWIESRRNYLPFVVFKKGLYDNYKDHIKNEANKDTPQLGHSNIKNIFSYLCPLYPKTRVFTYTKNNS